MAQAAQAPPSQSEIAYERLDAAIRAGVFKPGERMREVDVAERLGLGRTPIRDAFRRLEADGIIEHRPRLGAVIRTLSQPEIIELYEMRIVLERTAAEFASQHATMAELDELADLNDELLANQDNPAEAARLNAIFHRCLYVAARNRFLLESARALNNALMLLGPTTLDDTDRVRLVHAQHAEIIQAVREGARGAAGGAAARHIEVSLRCRLKSLRT